ncbi:ankyrin repeat and SOCS box protein 5 isoform X1 [Anarrhichthys ocellatus]|uniref:ankyrin repeat and SOCS box protein 5 isoform X1 n=1 Tax=Anarrhichthys ocellatus TaxID=433405 RepID=UPI0012EDE413|nr:ankyrin repeat and SOCS box protein 5-like isoform X1 [Anarrhichthys ocellatus]
MSDPTEELSNKTFVARLSNVYLSILALFCFKLFVKISLNLLTYLYIVRGNRKEAARISAEFYDYGQKHRSWADRSPLHDAASQGRLLALKTLILQVNASTIDGVTPLFNACTLGSVVCTEILLENGAKPQNLAYHPSPIHEATSKGHYGCVEALVTWGADVDMDIPHLGTALYTACVCQELECARKLLREGASVQKGKYLDSPLHAAAEKDCTAVVKLLLDFGADINARNTEFQRPVDVAPPSSLTEGFLLIYEVTPRRLSQLCRQCIRSCVGRDRLHLLSHLRLPNRLRNYLQYQ